VFEPGYQHINLRIEYFFATMPPIIKIAVGLAATLTCAQATAIGSKVANVSINTNVKFQELDGFGVSQAFQRAEDIYGKEGLSSKNTTLVLDLLFSIDKGAGFAILRDGIGSSNSSTSNFIKSIEPFSPGSPSARPHYLWDRNDSG
jgi:O-glycosyl hydrolase